MSPQDKILQHTSLPESRRDLSWEKNFLQMFSDALVTIVSDTPENGPDNFPYLLVEIRPDSTEPAKKVIEWLAPRGIGLVVNAQKIYPDYIFPWGMLWNFAERSQFLTEDPIQAEKTLEINPGDKLLAGEPHPQYLPNYARGIIKQFLLDQGVFAPKILLVGNKEQAKHFSQFDLCFSLESLGNPPPSEHEGILKALSWFLPTHYSLALVPEKDLKIPFVTL